MCTKCVLIKLVVNYVILKIVQNTAEVEAAVISKI